MYTLELSIRNRDLGVIYFSVKTCNLGANDDSAEVKVSFLKSNRKSVFLRIFRKRAKFLKKDGKTMFR
jgi:hypothetical protein